MARKRSPGIAISSLQEALQTGRVRDALSLDRRSLKSGRALIAGLEAQARPSEIARGLGISTQKYVSIRRNVQAGRAASPVLNDLLRETAVKIQETSAAPGAARGKYETETTRGKRREYGIDYIEAGEDFVRGKMKFASKVKQFASLKSALNWYGGVTGGKEYFWIVKNKKGGYSIYDVRTSAERSRKGAINKKTRAQETLERYERPTAKRSSHAKRSAKRGGKTRTRGGRK